MKIEWPYNTGKQIGKEGRNKGLMAEGFAAQAIASAGRENKGSVTLVHRSGDIRQAIPKPSEPIGYLPHAALALDCQHATPNNALPNKRMPWVSLNYLSWYHDG